MELQAVRAAHTERLIHTLIAAGKQLRAGRKSKGVTVPMKDGKLASRSSQHDVSFTGGGQRHTSEAHLCCGRGKHLGAERVGKELRAETDT